MPRARTIAARVAVFFALGILVTISIAWWIEALDKRRPVSIMVMSGSPASQRVGAWIGDVPDGWPLRPRAEALLGQGGRINPTSLRVEGAERLWIRRGMFTGVSSSGAGLVFLQDDPSHVTDRYEVGWPVRTMTRRGPDDSRPAAPGIAGLFRDGAPIGGERALPIQPIWKPFLLSAVCWAAVCASPWMLSRGLRAFVVRRRRGSDRCPACGYDWAALPACPECGVIRSHAERR
jgi:hypothetical protein